MLSAASAPAGSPCRCPEGSCLTEHSVHAAYSPQSSDEAWKIHSSPSVLPPFLFFPSWRTHHPMSQSLPCGSRIQNNRSPLSGGTKGRSQSGNPASASLPAYAYKKRFPPVPCGSQSPSPASKDTGRHGHRMPRTHNPDMR